MRFNEQKYREMYERIKQDALREGYSEKELEKPYLDQLSKQTKSQRIMKMIRLAYWLGWLRGIKYCDEMHTPISVRGGTVDEQRK